MVNALEDAPVDLGYTTDDKAPTRASKALDKVGTLEVIINQTNKPNGLILAQTSGDEAMVIEFRKRLSEALADTALIKRIRKGHYGYGNWNSFDGSNDVAIEAHPEELYVSDTQKNEELTLVINTAQTILDEMARERGLTKAAGPHSARVIGEDRGGVAQAIRDWADREELANRDGSPISPLQIADLQAALGALVAHRN